MRSRCAIHLAELPGGVECAAAETAAARDRTPCAPGAASPTSPCRWNTSSPACADNWFSHEYRNHAVISIFDWNGTYAPPSLKSYIIYQIAQALIHFAAELTEEITLNIVHEPPQGCMYDMCTNKPDIKLGMVAGSLCPRCKATLFQFGTSTVAIEAVERLLEYVRSEAIGKPKLIDPKKAFIVMRFSANDENDHAYQYGIKPALEELHIDCTRADTEVRSAQLLEKIKSNIDKSRLVIAKVDIENLNVFFELSLAMGQNKDVILVSESTLVLSLPSDLRNWECITYDKGNFLMLKTKILDYLRQNYVYK
jgi:hypothetical protein